MKVTIRADASLQMGTGHIMRCLTLAQGLSEIGCEVIFLCKPHDGNLIDKIQSSGFSCLTLSDPALAQDDDDLTHAGWLGASQDDDAQECRDIFQDIYPKWVVVDHYALDFRWEKQIKPLCDKLMVIDDLTDRKHDCDLLLNQNLGFSEDQYQELTPDQCKILVGPNYALLRSEFRQWRSKSLQHRREQTEIRNILVSIGGVDPDNYTNQVLERIALSKVSPDVSITVVMGRHSPHLNEVKALAKSFRHKVRVVVDAANMAELMSLADLAIGASGSTSWERCCLGLPSIQIVTASNQKILAMTMASSNLIKYATGICDISEFLQTASDWTSELSVKSAHICDGKGIARVLNSMFYGDCNLLTENYGVASLTNYCNLEEGKSVEILSLRNSELVRCSMLNSRVITLGGHRKFIKELDSSLDKAYFTVTKFSNMVGVIYFTEIDFNKHKANVGLFSNVKNKVERAGSMLMEAILAYGRVLSLNKLCLVVLRKNDAARGLYNKYGFTEVDYFVKSNQDVIAMEKKL